VDENELIVPLQQVMGSMDDYGDPNWDSEPVDARPGG
jgi:anaphase-promoting complex subunit 2